MVQSGRTITVIIQFAFLITSRIWNNINRVRTFNTRQLFKPTILAKNTAIPERRIGPKKLISTIAWINTNKINRPILHFALRKIEAFKGNFYYSGITEITDFGIRIPQHIKTFVFSICRYFCIGLYSYWTYKKLMHLLIIFKWIQYKSHKITR